MSAPKGSALASHADVVLTPIALLLTRVVFGPAFFLVGLDKFHELEKTTAAFRDLRIPLASAQAPLVAAIECVGGLLLLIGFGTRIAAALLVCTMVVALLMAHWGEFLDGLLFRLNLAQVAPLPYLIAVLWLGAKGAGTFSVDHLFARSKKAA